MEQIVVGVDGSESSRKALAWALAEARLRGDATVVLAHGYRLPEARSPYAYSYPYLNAATVRTVATQDRVWREQQEDAARQRAEMLVDHALDRAGGADGLPIVKRLVVARRPVELLVDISRDADLLVVGSRGRGGFKGLLLGSVSQQCVHHAHCPVVVVR